MWFNIATRASTIREQLSTLHGMAPRHPLILGPPVGVPLRYRSCMCRLHRSRSRFERREFGGPGSSADRRRHWHIIQFEARLSASQHQPTAAHITPAYEFFGKHKMWSENFKQRVDIFSRRDTAEQNNLGTRRKLAGQCAGIAEKRFAVSTIAQINRDPRHFHQIIQCDRGVWRQKSTRGGQRQHWGRTRRRIPKGFGIGEFAAKIQAADETEDFTEWRALSPDPIRKFELRVRV
jgi:hypothetical protein